MINEEDSEYIVDALKNIAFFSVDLKNLNDSIAGESTRVMNIYSKYVKDNDKNKMIYEKANAIMNKCESINKHIYKLRAFIEDLLLTIGEI